MYPLHQWTFPDQYPFELRQSGLKIIKKDFSIEQISKNKRSMLEIMFNPLLRAYGHTDKTIYDKYEFFLKKCNVKLD